jgi:hypothetical protein
MGPLSKSFGAHISVFFLKWISNLGLISNYGFNVVDSEAAGCRRLRGPLTTGFDDRIGCSSRDSWTDLIGIVLHLMPFLFQNYFTVI